jgi:hypothetical protein
MTSKLGRDDRSRRGALEQVNRLAWLLDNAIPIPVINYRIGLDALIGLIPGLGDTAGLLMSSFIVIQAVRLGAPGATLMRMVLNIAIEALIGLIPILGDVFDATFKANARNVRLLTLAVDPQQAGSAPGRSARDRGIVAVFAVLAGIIALLAGAGVALFWGVISLFR